MMIEFDAPTEEQLASLREKHGDLVEVEESGRTFVVVKAQNPRAALQRFTSMVGNEAKRFEAFDGLAKSATVFPDKETLKKVLEDEPGLVFMLGEEASKLLGMRQGAAKKG